MNQFRCLRAGCCCRQLFWVLRVLRAPRALPHGPRSWFTFYAHHCRLMPTDRLFCAPCYVAHRRLYRFHLGCTHVYAHTPTCHVSAFWLLRFSAATHVPLPHAPPPSTLPPTTFHYVSPLRSRLHVSFLVTGFDSAPHLTARLPRFTHAFTPVWLCRGLPVLRLHCAAPSRTYCLRLHAAVYRSATRYLLAARSHTWTSSLHGRTRARRMPPHHAAHWFCRLRTCTIPHRCAVLSPSAGLPLLDTPRFTHTGHYIALFAAVC